MLSYAKSATARPGDRLNGFENGKTQLFNSWSVVKWAYFFKKVEFSFKSMLFFPIHSLVIKVSVTWITVNVKILHNLIRREMREECMGNLFENIHDKTTLQFLCMLKNVRAQNT